MSQGRVQIFQLTPGKHYSVEVVGVVVKKWRNNFDGKKEFVTVWLTDWTSHDKLRPADIKGSPAPTGKYTYRIDIFQPHMAAVDSDLPVGTVGSFRNVHVKLSPTGELEGCIFAGRQKYAINVSALKEHDQRYKDLMKQKRTFEALKPMSKNRKRKIKKEEARQERVAAEAAAEAESAAEKNAKRPKVSYDQPFVSNEGTPPPSVHHPDIPKLTKSQELAAQNAERLAVGVRRQLEQMHEYIGQALEGSNPICRDDLERTLSEFTEQITMRTATELNQVSFPMATVFHDINLTFQRKLLYLEPKPHDKRPHNAVCQGEFERIGKDCLERPWSLRAAQKRRVHYPQGYEPFLADTTNYRVRLFDSKLRTPMLGDCPLMLCKDDRFINRRVSMSVKVVDFYPHDIHKFVQRHTVNSESRHKEHKGDRFEFWLYVRTREELTETATGMDLKQKSAEFKVWVPNDAAEKLLGLTASDVVDSCEEGLYVLRARLRELWGDLEFIKSALSTALKIQHNDAKMSADKGRGWRGNSPVQISSPQIEIGVRRMLLQQPDGDSATMRPPWSDLGPHDNTRLVLEGTEVVTE